MAFKDQTEKFYNKEHNLYLILNNTCSSRSFVLKTFKTLTFVLSDFVLASILSSQIRL
jgi:hypothetical protein